MPVATELHTVIKVCPKIGLSLAMPMCSIGIEIMNIALRWGFTVVDLPENILVLLNQAQRLVYA